MSQHRVLGSTLLVAGTAIGAGMLALPIVTAITGTFTAITLLVICFLFMLFNIFILLEAAFYCTAKEANIISIVKARLGNTGSIIAWLAFLLLLYSVLAAFITGGGELLGDAFGRVGFSVSGKLNTFAFVLLFGTIIYFRAGAVDYINRILMLCLVISFIVLIILLVSHAQMQPFKQGTPKYLWAAIPVVILSFTSHLIVPSLKHYLQSDIRLLKRALIMGSLIPLGFYLVWELLLISVLPMEGVFSLTSIARSTDPISSIANTFVNYLGISSIMINLLLFSFFALVTSFLGSTLSLFDFLADGLNIDKTDRGRLFLLGVSLIPPLLFVWYYPGGFLSALGYAGVFVAVLYGILPSLVVWKARYHEKLTSSFRVFGGKFTLIVMITGAVTVICLHIATVFNWLPSL